jgi:hypothetical protein
MRRAIETGGTLAVLAMAAGQRSALL